MKPADDDLFKPLSAKVGRKKFSTGGREQEGKLRRDGDGRKWQQFLQKRADDRHPAGEGDVVG